jgi:hypothetical protein
MVEVKALNGEKSMAFVFPIEQDHSRSDPVKTSSNSIKASSWLSQMRKPLILSSPLICGW